MNRQILTFRRMEQFTDCLLDDRDEARKTALNLDGEGSFPSRSHYGMRGKWARDSGFGFTWAFRPAETEAEVGTGGDPSINR